MFTFIKRQRAAKTRTFGGINAEAEELFKDMAKLSPVEYVRQVKAEMQKVTWPSRQELTSSTIAVFIMVFLAAVFLFVADQVLAFGVNKILGLN